MQPITADQLLATLGHHKGQAKGIHVRQLAMQVYGELAVTGAQERAVRKLVNDLRMDGQPICAHPAHVYFIAETHAELQHTCAFLRARAMSSLAAYSRLKKISATQLLGNQTDGITRPTDSTDPATEKEQFNYEQY